MENKTITAVGIDVSKGKSTVAVRRPGGMDAPPFQSGSFDAKSRRISKRGSPHLRRTLFQIVSTILQHSDPADRLALLYPFLCRQKFLYFFILGLDTYLLVCHYCQDLQKGLNILRINGILFHVISTNRNLCVLGGQGKQ